MNVPITYGLCRFGLEGLEVLPEILINLTQGGQHSKTESQQKAGTLGG